MRTTPGNIPAFDVRELETRLAAAARRWEDDLKQALIESAGEARGNDYFRRFGAAFPAAYREDFTARNAVPDIGTMAKLSEVLERQQSGTPMIEHNIGYTRNAAVS